MNVLKDQYFGNLTIKGIAEISTEHSFDFFPLAWGWYVIAILIFLYYLKYLYSKREKRRENQFIYDYIKFLKGENVTLLDIANVLHSVQQRKEIDRSSSLSFYETKYGREIYNYLYQNSQMPENEFSKLKKLSLSWLEERCQ